MLLLSCLMSLSSELGVLQVGELENRNGSGPDFHNVLRGKCKYEQLKHFFLEPRNVKNGLVLLS